MATEYGRWKHGAVEYPLTPSIAKKLIEDADPALFHVARLVEEVLNIDIGERLLEQADANGLKIERAVLKTVHLDPIPVLHSDQFRFPLLAIYRRTEAQLEHTLSWQKDVSEWEVAYVLPPLTPVQQIELNPILRAASRSIAHVLHTGWHPDFEEGRQVLAEAGIMSAKAGITRYGGYAAISELENSGFYRAIQMSVEIVERSHSPVGAFPSFAGANTNIDLQHADTTVTANVARAETYQPPAITSIVPNTGSKAGGTSVTITGARFRGPVSVRFGSVAVEATVDSDTQLSCATPAHNAYPTLMADVVVTNGDDQTARVPAGFTFTTP